MDTLGTVNCYCFPFVCLTAFSEAVMPEITMSGRKYVTANIQGVPGVM